MYRVLVTLKVNDFNALNEFESKASGLMSKYKGRIVRAFETLRNNDGSGEEVHLIEFQTENCFKDYLNDCWHRENKELREMAISGTEIVLNPREKVYSCEADLS